MKKYFGLLLIGASIFTTGCGNNDKKQASEKKEATSNAADAKNFNAEADAAPGTVISELSYTEKGDGKEKTGKRITKFFDDTAKVVVTVYKKANDEVYDFSSFTVNKAEAKSLKADLTPMNDGSDNYTTYDPKDFGAVSLVFVAEGGEKDANIVSVKSLSFFMNERKEQLTKENGFNMPLKDFKTAEEWVNKLKNSFKK
jgi:hypothetical protein